MLRLLLLILPVIVCLRAWTQEKETSGNEQQLENQAQLDEEVTEDDSYWQHLEFLRRHPLNLNTATDTDLQELHMLSALQVTNFFRYKKLLGNLLNIYELQAIPSWDIYTIRKLLPFITVGTIETVPETILQRLHSGDKSLLIRFSQVLEQAKGFLKSSTGNNYLGSRPKLLFRYKYNYKNLLEYGVLGDKDAGEQFFKTHQSKGFDFYSFHFFARRMGRIQSLAIGDFTVNMGQGLVQWQSLAFKKSASVLEVKRQSAVLRPYTSAGEFNFYRGAGITIRQKKWETSVFGSLRKVSAHLVPDSLYDEGESVSSVSTTGYHRTTAELSGRNTVQHVASGGTIKFRHTNWHAAFNLVNHHFSRFLAASSEPYDLFAITGKNWLNYSIDYSYTFRNLHMFGEVGVDKNANNALLHGMLLGVDTKTDLSFVYRNISKTYQSLFSNAFTENTLPTNENGLYAGISTRPVTGFKLDAYADFFKFPWLKFRVDAPSAGSDYMVQLTYTPNKQAAVYSRFRNETKTINLPGTEQAVHLPEAIPKKNWRTQVDFSVSKEMLIRSRLELVWYGKADADNKEKGFLFFTDLHYKPLSKPLSAAIRVQFFETGGYNSRVYAYENNVLYSFSIPAFYGKGMRYYVTINYKNGRQVRTGKISWLLSLNFSQSVYPSQTSIGTALDEINGKKKSEVRLQVITMIK